MAVTLQELIDRSVLQAKRGLAQAPPNLELIAAACAPQVFHEVGREAARDERLRSLLTVPKSVSFTNGVGTLTSDVLTKHRDSSSLRDTADETKMYSFVPNWDDFASVYDTRLGYYHITDGNSIYVIEPGDVFEEGEGLTGSLALRIVCAPQIPATASTAIDAPEEITDLLVLRLGEALVMKAQEAVAA